MTETLEKNELIIAYLFGELPFYRITEIEERMFHNDEFFEQIQTAERRLIEQYVQDELPAALKIRFEKKYLNSPERREKVNQVHLALEKIKPFQTPKPSWSKRLATLFKLPTLGYAAAALLLALSVAIVWLIFERERLTQLAQNNQEIEEIRKNSASLENELRAQIEQKQKELNEQTTADEETTSQLLREKERLEQELKKVKAILPKTDNAGAIIFATLVPTGRGGGAPAQIVVNNNTRTVNLQIPLSAPTPALAYKVTVRRADNKQIITERRSIKPRSTKRGITLSINFPARKFAGGSYEVLAEGLSQNETEKSAEMFILNVTKD
jgi:Sec-independent protein translocase protein TatA